MLPGVFFIPIIRALFAYALCAELTDAEAAASGRGDFVNIGPRLLDAPELACFMEDHMPYLRLAMTLAPFTVLTVNSISPYFIEDLSGKVEIQFPPFYQVTLVLPSPVAYHSIPGLDLP